MGDYTVPGMTKKDADEVLSMLAGRLASLLDLSLTLKHIHWNVMGEECIAVHKMLDPQVDSVRAMVDETADTTREQVAQLDVWANRCSARRIVLVASALSMPRIAAGVGAVIGGLEPVSREGGMARYDFDGFAVQLWGMPEPRG